MNDIPEIYLQQYFGVHGDLFCRLEVSYKDAEGKHKQRKLALSDRNLNKRLFNLCAKIARDKGRNSAYAQAVYDHNLKPLSRDYRDYLIEREELEKA